MSELKKAVMQIEGNDYIYSPVLTGEDESVLFSSQMSVYGNYAWNAFKEDVDLAYATSWYSNGFSQLVPEWVGFDYGEEVSKKGVVLIYDTTSSHAIDYQIQYENRQGEWVDILSLENQVPFEKNGKTVLYLFEQAVIAQKFRYRVTRNHVAYATVLHRLRFIDDEGGMPGEAFKVTEKYQDESGNQLQPDAFKTVAGGEAYSATAPALGGYKAIGYKIDAGALVAGTTITIPAVVANHTVIFVYKQADDNCGDKQECKCKVGFIPIVFCESDCQDISQLLSCMCKCKKEQ